VPILGNATGPSLGLVSTIVTSAIELTKPKGVLDYFKRFICSLARFSVRNRVESTVGSNNSCNKVAPGHPCNWFQGHLVYLQQLGHTVQRLVSIETFWITILQNGLLCLNSKQYVS
jgi:hypothetical protein